MPLRANRNYDPSNEGVWHFTLEGCWGAEFIDELQPEPGDLVVTKFRSSAFAARTSTCCCAPTASAR